MIPGNSLSNPTPLWAAYLPPPGNGITSITDICKGGIALFDGTQGLNVQDWKLIVTFDGVMGSVYIYTDIIAPIFILTSENITWARLAFDQNMFPFIAYVDITGAKYYWYDPTTHIPAIVSLGDGVSNPCCTMDDKRDLATRVGSNDIILAYVKDGNLVYRQERDRYATEYTLQIGISDMIPNAILWRVSMNEKFRLQFLFHGNLYQ